MREVVLFLVALVLGSCGGAAPVELGSANWIWAPSLAVAKGRELGVVFVRDFELAAQPTTAQLLLRAGDGFVVWVNGTAVAAVATPDRCTVSRIDLRRWLRQGANRLAVEVRSEGHYGGVIGCVTVDDECVVPTDARWSLEPAADPALMMGWRVAAGVPAAEIAPGNLASRCLVVRDAPGLDCLAQPEVVVPHHEADGSARLELASPGLVELRFAAPATGQRIRIETSKVTWETPALAGAIGALDPIPWDAGGADVAGLGIGEVRLWPWQPACGPLPAARPVVLPTLFGLAPPQGVVEAGGGTGAKL